MTDTLSRRERLIQACAVIAVAANTAGAADRAQRMLADPSYRAQVIADVTEGDRPLPPKKVRRAADALAEWEGLVL